MMNDIYHKIEVYFQSKEKAEQAIDYMRNIIKESNKQFASVYDLIQYCGYLSVSWRFAQIDDKELKNWGWTNIDGYSIYRNPVKTTIVLAMPPAERMYYPLTSPPPPYIPRGDGKTMTAMKMIEDICKNDKLRNDINKGDVETMPTQYEFSRLMLFSPFTYTSEVTISSARVRCPKIVNIEMYNDRVVKVTFDDGSFTKSVCQKNDIFDLDVGITICLIKKMLDTGKGDGTRVYNNIIRDAHKLINDKENEKIEKQIEKDKRKKKAHKAMMNKQAKKMKAKEEAIDIQKQAIIRAYQEMELMKDGE